MAPAYDDATTQLDLGVSTSGPHGERRAYVMVRVGDAVTVEAIDEGDRLVVGRGQDADVVVADGRVSRRHSELFVRDGQLFVRDLGGRNGTKIDGRILRDTACALGRGQNVAIGPCELGVVSLPSPIPTRSEADPLAVDPRTEEAFALARRLAATPTTVLVRGETGAGKEVIAEILHSHGPRAAKPLIRLNCGAVPANLLESELFGHEKGAFTGATSTKKGYLEAAHGGTLFLDEIGDLPLALQVKLLRALETQRLQRVGGREEISVDVRIVCATHRDLEAMVSDGAFRQDLYYRIAGFVLEVPPLRERPGDLLPLAQRFVAAFATQLGAGTPSLSDAAVEVLRGHHWPGNVRELRNAVEHAVVLCGPGPIEPEHLPAAVTSPASPASASGRLPPTMKEAVDEAERQALLQALEATGGHRARTAELLGVSKRTLQYKLSKHGVTE